MDKLSFNELAELVEGSIVILTVDSKKYVCVVDSINTDKTYKLKHTLTEYPNNINTQLTVPIKFITDTNLLIPDNYLNPEYQGELYDTLVGLNDLKNKDELQRIQQEKKRELDYRPTTVDRIAGLGRGSRKSKRRKSKRRKSKRRKSKRRKSKRRKSKRRKSKRR
jgi:hypothetical protein